MIARAGVKMVVKGIGNAIINSSQLNILLAEPPLLFLQE
jgi:hypothetical protein